MNAQEPSTDAEHLSKIAGMKESLNKALQEGRQNMTHYAALGYAYKKRYDVTHEQQYLDNAITTYKGGLGNVPGTTEKYGWLLNALGTASLAMYNKFGGLDDLEKAVDCLSMAVELYQTGNHIRSKYLNNLGSALQARYDNFGEMEDLENVIHCHRQALDLRPFGHPERSGSLTNLGNALQTRYDQLGEIKDLEMAIGYHEETLELDPPDHPYMSMSLNSLANALQTRYLQLGEMEDLEKTISYHEQALDLRPPGHPHRSTSLINLGVALQTRYEQLRDMEDLGRAINYHEQTLELHPSGHPRRSGSLMNLGNALDTRYDQLGEMEDLEKAISYHEQALELHPSGHPHRSRCLINLGNALQIRYEQLEKMGDLEKAISYHEQALELDPSGHPHRSSSLMHLATALQTRYTQLGEMRDLEKAIRYLENALELCPSGHTLRPACLNNLGGVYYIHYEYSANNESLSQAIDYYRQAAYTTSHMPHMLNGAKEWAFIAHTHKLSSGTPAYSLAMSLLHQHIALLPSLTSQQKIVEKSSCLSLDAAAWAIENDRLDIAVQYLEQGRSILWSKIQGYKQPLEDISKRDPHLAQEFHQISSILENNATSDGTDITLHNSQYKKWITLLEKIRALDGLSDYLQATPFESLKDACAEGPVIMVNISDFRSDAIILVLNSPPIVIPLQDATPQRLEGLEIQLFQATATSDSPRTIYKILQYLWNTIVQPVVKQLKQLKVPEKSHIWWCPTSCLCALPLHAAGPYQKGSKNLPDMYISSYTPTLGSLIKARSNISRNKPALSLLLVSQPDDTIPQVFEEAKVINRVQVQVNLISGCNADKQCVLESLQSHPWVHFACHGHLEAQPFHSWFQLHNREHLTVLDLAKTQLPNAEFAFLSACHSAAGSVHGTPDESIHLAGALQVSGFPCVVGTLWGMVDDDGPPIADAFYREIFADVSNVDVRDTAMALNLATKELRRKNVSVDRWINFIHLGA